jgi:Bacterial archaeo-eukaryotic release factor family 2
MRLDFLRPLYTGPGDYASLYLDASRTTEDAAELVALRWRAARERLAECGAEAGVLDALEDLVTGQTHSVPGLAAFATQGRVAYAAGLPHPPRREVSRYARLPHVMPLLAQWPPQPPQLHIRADRSGGEIVAVRPNGMLREDPSDAAAREEVTGQAWPVHKTRVGGWSQARYQRAAEEAWAENAKELAAAVTAAATRYHAEFIVVAGDLRARSLLLDQLSTPLRESAVIVDREVDATSDLTGEVAEAATRARADEQTRDRLEQFRGQLGTGQAVEGLAETLAALRDGQASDVLIADGSSSTAGAWVGPEPADVACTREELAERGVEKAVPDRADAAVVRAAAATGAELHFVPDGEQPPRAGIGALLRFAVTPG